ncbi:hypothetical protein LMBIIBHN_04184 [Aeromonas salmonicida]
MRRLPQRAIGDPLYGPAIGSRNDDADQEGASQQQEGAVDAHHHEPGHHHKGDIGADHVNLAVGEVDHADDAIDHGVADGDQRIGATYG